MQEKKGRETVKQKAQKQPWKENGDERNKSYDKTFEWLCVSVSYSVCKCSLWCLHVIVEDLLCFDFVVEVCFVSSALAAYPVSVSNWKEWPEGKTAGREDSKRGEWMQEEGVGV